MTGGLNQAGATAGSATELRRTRQRMVWAILGAALLARLMVLWIAVRTYPHDWLYSRGIEMGLLANSLLHGLGYSSPFGGSTGPTAFIAPGYPTLIAGIFLVFGTYSFASAVAIMALQIAVSVGTVWLMMWIAREVMDDRTAYVAGAFWAVSAPLLWIPTIFWETSISACVLTGMVALALRCSRAPSRHGWVLIGACCGLTALINPALLPSLMGILGWLAWQTIRRAKRSWRGPAIGVVALLVVFCAWPIRNAVRFHAFIPLRSTVGFELWMGNRPGATGYLNESLFPMYNKAELASYVAQGELAYTNGKAAEAKSYILANPGWFVRMTARRVFRFWTGTGNSVGSPFYAIHAVATTVLGLVGVGMLWRRRRFALVALVAIPLMLFPLPYYITHAEFRYRLLIDPLLTVLAGYAVTRMVGRGEDGVSQGLKPQS